MAIIDADASAIVKEKEKEFCGDQSMASSGD